MPTISEIGRHLGVSQPRASQLVKEGCPTNSLRAAELWREKRGLKRAPVNGRFADGTPVEHPDGLEPIPRKKRGRPLKPKPVIRTGDSLLDALNSSIAVQERAYEEFDKAMCTGTTARISPLLHVHNKALEARFMAEKAYREEMERRGLLVDKTVIVELCRRTMESVLRRLKKLPQEVGPQCVGDDPLRSVKILDAEVNKIIATGRKALEDASQS